MKFSIEIERSSVGWKRVRVSASVGGVIMLLMVGIAGATAIMKPADVKKTDSAVSVSSRLKVDLVCAGPVVTVSRSS